MCIKTALTLLAIVIASNFHVYLCAHIWQDFLNMFFRNKFKPIPLAYNLIIAMLWRHPENVVLDEVKVVHYCAAVSTMALYQNSPINKYSKY